MADSTAQTYRQAALENLERAQSCFETGSYFLAHYLFGLAVECHLRAWLRRKTNRFDARHNLEQLAKDSGFYEVFSPQSVDTFSQSFTTLNIRWNSNHRYYSERQFEKYLLSCNIKREDRPEWDAKGDKWKNLCRVVQNIAYSVINAGEASWNSYEKKSKTTTGKVAGRRRRRTP